MTTVYQESLERQVAAERTSAITYDIGRVSCWQRRQGASYARRPQGFILRLLAKWRNAR